MIACDDNVVTNAGATCSTSRWALVYNDSDSDSSKSSFDLIAGATAVFNASGGSASHTNSTGAEDFVGFTDSGGNGPSTTRCRTAKGARTPATCAGKTRRGR